MDHRTVFMVGAIMRFLQTQAGEFTAQEIRRLGTGFHCDNDEDEVEAACATLASAGFIRSIASEGYQAFARLI
jgi:hypothetical protein